MPPDAFTYLPIICDFFNFKGHACIVQDLCGNNLLSVLAQNEYKGLSLAVIQNVAGDLLRALSIIHSIGIIHADLKPENVVQNNPLSGHVKLIDFGNCQSVGAYAPGYFQSRYYRAPEILLRLPFDTKIDIWALGCLLCELYLALPILPAQSEAHLASLIELTIGPFPPNMVDQSPLKETYFNSDYTVKPNEVLWAEIPEQEFSQFEPYFFSPQLFDIIHNYPINRRFSEERIELENEHRRIFYSFVKEMLTIDPQDRCTAEQALEHPFMKLKLS